MYYTGPKSNTDSSCPKAACYPPFLAWKLNASLACRCCVLQASDGHLNRWVHLSMPTLLQMMMQLQPKPHPQHPKQVGTLNKCRINQFNCYKFTFKNDENHSNLATTKVKFNLQSYSKMCIFSNRPPRSKLFLGLSFTPDVNIQMYVCLPAYML